jgi:hypothetical protein
MRDIEVSMVVALRARKGRALGNTNVSAPDANGIARVFLHGNEIARLNHGNGMLGLTLAGWPTPTTRSRVNVLLRTFANTSSVFHGVGQRKGVQYYSRWGLDGAYLTNQVIEPTEWITVQVGAV